MAASWAEAVEWQRSAAPLAEFFHRCVCDGTMAKSHSSFADDRRLSLPRGDFVRNGRSHCLTSAYCPQGGLLEPYPSVVPLQPGPYPQRPCWHRHPHMECSARPQETELKRFCQCQVDRSRSQGGSKQAYRAVPSDVEHAMLILSPAPSTAFHRAALLRLYPPILIFRHDTLHSGQRRLQAVVLLAFEV